MASGVMGVVERLGGTGSMREGLIERSERVGASARAGFGVVAASRRICFL